MQTNKWIACPPLVVWLWGACLISAQVPDSLSLLKNTLGDSAQSRGTNNNVIEYCPDNTCDVFSSPEEDQPEGVADVTLIYLYFVSDYIYLDSWRTNLDIGRVRAVLDRNAGECPTDDQSALVECVLTTLSERARVEIRFVRYDEADRHEVLVNLDEILSNRP